MRPRDNIRAVVFEVREFCLHDGPGIRTTVFFKGCPLRCKWCHNPEGMSPHPEVLFKEQNCRHCGACENGGDCPHSARVACGKIYSAQELAREVLVNSDVMKSSGGGITFSGGEPLMQCSFLMELMPLLAGHHIAIETSGHAENEDYKNVVSKCDLVYQDLKHPDAQEHKRLTGVDPVKIHENLLWLKDSGKPFIARIPLIPGVNDGGEAKEGFAKLLEGRSGLIRLELLPYHRTAGAKYAWTGRAYAPGFDEARAPDTDVSIFLKHNIKTEIL